MEAFKIMKKTVTIKSGENSLNDNIACKVIIIKILE